MGKAAERRDRNGERRSAALNALQSIEGEIGLPLMVALLAIAHEEGLSVNELAERIGVPQQTASRYVAILQGRYHMPDSSENALARNPLVSVEICDADPRRRAIFLTRKGQAQVSTVLNELYGGKCLEQE